MERVLKRGSLVFVVALAALLLVTNLEATHASDEANEQNRQLLSSDNQFVFSPPSQTVANDNQAVLSQLNTQTYLISLSSCVNIEAEETRLN